MARHRERVRPQPTADAVANVVAPNAKGDPLPRDTRARMEGAFHHDFSAIRIHADETAADAATALRARAFTVGRDLVFDESEFNPYSFHGEQLLAHELAHSIQQERAGGTGHDSADRHMDIVAPDHPTETAAHDAAAAAVQGQPVDTASLTGTANVGGAVHRWPWDDDSGGSGGGGGILDTLSSVASSAASILPGVGPVGGVASAATGGGLLDSLGSTASSVGGSIAGGAKSAFNWANSAGKSIGDAESAIGRGALNAGKGIIDAQHTGGEILSLGEEEVDKGINSVEDALKHKKSNTGNSTLDAMNDAGGWLGDQSVGFMGGLLKSGVGLVGGLGKMAVDPISTLKGVEAFAEHDMNWLPGVGTMLKGAHGAYDILNHTDKEKAQYGTSWGELAGHLFNPVTAGQDDAKFNGALATSILAPGKDGWQNWIDRPGDAAGHAFGNIGQFFIGAGEVGAAGDAAKVGEALTDADKAAAAANDANKARQAGTVPKFDPTVPQDWGDLLPDLRPKPSGGPPPRTPIPIPEPTLGGRIAGAWDSVTDWLGDVFGGGGPKDPPASPPTRIKNVHLRPDDIPRRRNKGV